MNKFWRHIFLFISTATAFTCNNINSSLNSQNNTIIQTGEIEVNGLSSFEKVTLQSATGETIDILINGKFYQSGTMIPAQSIVSPEILSSPQGKQCALESSLSNNNIYYSIQCIPIQYCTIGGTISGLSSSSLLLRLNDFLPIAVNSDGTFQFAQVLPENSPWTVTLERQPGNNQLCSINNGNGIINNNVKTIEITCASDVYSLSGIIADHAPGLSLQNSNGEILEIPTNANSFIFSKFLPTGTNFEVSVLNQPYGEYCYINNGHGRINANISNVEVACAPTANLAINISIDENQIPDTLKNVQLWFYTDQNQVVYPVIKKSLTLTKSRVYSVTIPQGHFYIRAFLDLNENILPDLGTEPQSILYNFNSAADNNQLDVSLDSTLTDSHLQSFNTFIFNTAVWYQPGGGKCGGTYLRLEASGFSGSKAHLSGIYVILPDYNVLELYDDGGCGDAFNNNSSSYDRKSGDMELSAGIDASNQVYSGKYIFYYVNYVSGKIHIAEDSIASVLALSSNITLTKPSGSAPLQSARPILEWNIIGGAISYEVLLESADQLINNFSDPLRFVHSNSYQLPFDLADNQSYRVNIQAFDNDLSENFTDFDSVAQGPDNYFITDFSGQNSILISGKIINQSGVSGSIMLYGHSNADRGTWESSAFLSPGSDNYSLAVFKNSGKYGALISGIDLDQSGFINSGNNKVYAKWSTGLKLDQNLSLDLVWNIPLILISPENETRNQGAYPVFSWEDYSQYSTNSTSYLLWISPHISSQSPIIIGLKDNEFDFGHPGMHPYYNLSEVYLCSINSSGPGDAYNNCPANSANAAPEGFEYNTRWDWKVLVVPCNFDDYLMQNDYNRNGKSDYTECILQAFSGEIPAVTESISRIFSTH